MIHRISHDKTRSTWLFEHHPRFRQRDPPNVPVRGYVRLRKWPFSSTSNRVVHLPFNITEATLHPNGRTFCFTEASPTRHLYVARISDGSILAKSARLGNDRVKEMMWRTGGEIIGAVQRRGFVFYRSSDLAILGEVPAEYPSSVAFRPGTQEVALGTWNEFAIVLLSDILRGGITLN